MPRAFTLTFCLMLIFAGVSACDGQRTDPERIQAHHRNSSAQSFHEARNELDWLGTHQLAEIASRLLREISVVCGLPVHHEVPATLMTAAEQRAYYQQKDGELKPTAAELQFERGMQLATALLGLQPSSLDEDVQDGEDADDSTRPKGDVLGFYDPHNKAFFVRNDLRGKQQLFVMRHELMHALQDQSHQLEALRQGTLPNVDAFFALKATLEGQAMVAAALGGRAAKPQSRDTMTAAMLLEDMRFGAMNAVHASFGPYRLNDQLLPRWLEAATLERTDDDGPSLMQFYYEDGARFFAKLLERFPSKNFPYWVARSFAHMPTSTREILHPDVYLGHELTMPQEAVALTRALRQAADIEGAEIIWQTNFGELLTSLYLSPLRGGRFLAEHGVGDRLAMVQLGEEALPTLIWISAWADEQHAFQFARLVNRRQAYLQQVAQNEGAPPTRNLVQIYGHRVGVVVGLPDGPELRNRNFAKAIDAFEVAFLDDLMANDADLGLATDDAF